MQEYIFCRRRRRTNFLPNNPSVSDEKILPATLNFIGLGREIGWFTAYLGVSDEVWNIISLNTQLHRCPISGSRSRNLIFAPTRHDG